MAKFDVVLAVASLAICSLAGTAIGMTLVSRCYNLSTRPWINVASPKWLLVIVPSAVAGYFLYALFEQMTTIGG